MYWLTARRLLVATLVWLAAAPAARAQLPELVISIAEGGTIGGVPAENEDLLLCDLQASGPGSTQCNWSLFFDGSAAGFDTRVHGVDVVPNGNLIIRVSNDASLPDISAIKRTDLALFIPQNPFSLPYTTGEWRLYLDGDAVKGSSDTRVWDSVDVLTDGTCETTSPMSCDVLLSLASNATLGGLTFADEDIVRCHPTAFSLGGSITACQWSLFLDSSAINGGGSGSFVGQALAIDLPAANTLLFRAPNSPTLPTHDPARDLLRYIGTFGSSPAGTMDLFFDGNANGGLNGKTIQALAVYPDGDDDDIPDGLDNCPNVTNPGQEDTDGDGIGDACDADPDCNDPTPTDDDGDGIDDACDLCDDCFDPSNSDSDSDGECNPCDYCPFRPDPSCRCGDAIVDSPSEECDLGDGTNGAPASPCTASCEIAGMCTGSGTPCDDAGDCPPGQGCCGNSVREGDEECDDGNVIPDDLCANDCIFTTQGVPVLGCEDVPSSHLVPGFVRRAFFRESPAAGGAGFDRWSSMGDFNLGDGILIDADSEEVRVIFNQAGPTPLYQAILPPGSFAQTSTPTMTRWTFFDREADVPGALGFRRGRIAQSLNKVSYRMEGRNVPIDIDPAALGAPPIRLRATIRIGDDCATSVITCVANPTGKLLRCSSKPPPPTTTTTTSTTTTTM
jgi:hypothetical protein